MEKINKKYSQVTQYHIDLHIHTYLRACVYVGGRLNLYEEDITGLFKSREIRSKI